VESNLEDARSVLDALKELGIDMRWVLQKLEDDGVAAFEKSFDGLYANVAAKRSAHQRI
jgi:hypothetical protein